MAISRPFLSVFGVVALQCANEPPSSQAWIPNPTTVAHLMLQVSPGDAIIPDDPNDPDALDNLHADAVTATLQFGRSQPTHRSLLYNVADNSFATTFVAIAPGRYTLWASATGLSHHADTRFVTDITLQAAHSLLIHWTIDGKVTTTLVDESRLPAPPDRDSPAGSISHPADGPPDGPDGAPPPIAALQCLAPDTHELRLAAAPVTDSLVITEYMADPAAVPDNAGEWFELYNASTQPVDLNGLSLGRTFATTATQHIITSEECLPLQPGEYAVLANNDYPVTNGGLPAVLYRYSGLTLVNSNGGLFVSHGSKLLDQITYNSVQAGRSRELSRQTLSAAGNDNIANFCHGTQPFGAGDRGTPGQENDCP